MTEQAYLDEVNARRTFAIISHPDAGKTAITEKVRLKGVVQMLSTLNQIGWKWKNSVVFPSPHRSCNFLIMIV